MKLVNLVVLFFVSCVAFSQTLVSEKFYKKLDFKKEVKKDKGIYVKRELLNADSSTTTEVEKIETQEKISSETFLGEEPWGIWYKYGIQNFDYNFKLMYTESVCAGMNKIPIFNPVRFDVFKDQDSLAYKAPVFANNYSGLSNYLEKNLEYPEKARDAGIDGKTKIVFTIDEKGDVVNVFAIKNTDILLEKEAARIIKNMKFDSPPMYKDKPISLCFMLPITFAL
jgi:TonB family protein